MITQDEALRIALEFLSKLKPGSPEQLVIVKTREEPFGWVFFWNAKRFVETGDSRFGLSGNQPFVVLRGDGTAMWLPTLRWGSAEHARP